MEKERKLLIWFSRPLRILRFSDTWRAFLLQDPSGSVGERFRSGRAIEIRSGGTDVHLAREEEEVSSFIFLRAHAVCRCCRFSLSVFFASSSWLFLLQTSLSSLPTSYYLFSFSLSQQNKTNSRAPAQQKKATTANALPALDEHDKNGILVASFAACTYKAVEVGVGTVLTWFSYLLVAGAVAKLALGVSGATGEVGSIVAPAALAVQHLALYDVGTSVVCLFGVLVAKGLALGGPATLGLVATLGAAAYKGYASQWLTAAIAATSAKALFASGGNLKLDKQTVTRVGILAATAFVVAKDLYGPWVTVAALHATAVAGLNLATTVVDRLT